MATITHSKTNNIADWTQADLDAQIALGNFPSGTLLADIVLPSDWNDEHVITGLATVASTGSYNDLSDKPTIPTGTIDGTLTSNELVYSVDSNTVGSLSVATYPSLTEMTHVKGVTSAIQTQLNGKQPLATVLTNTTASFTTALETKLNGIEAGAQVNAIDTISDTSEIDLAITAKALSATIVAGSIDETKLDTSVNASLDLADTAVQPAALSAYVPYTGASANVDLGTFDLITDTVRASTSAGVLLKSANGTDIGLLGAGNTANAVWYGAHNFSAATQDTIAAFMGAGKTLGSLATATYPSLTELSYVKGANSSVACVDKVQAFSKQQTLTPQALTSTSNSIAWDANNGNNASHTATENTTLANPTNLVTGTVYTFQWTQHASSAKTLAFGNKWKFSGSSTVSTTLGAVNIITGLYDGTNINSVMTGPFT